jgi:hypothetical protein
MGRIAGFLLSERSFGGALCGTHHRDLGNYFGTFRN